MEEAFTHAALGLMSVIAGRSKIEANEERTISIRALDRENLLVRWLTEILYLSDAGKFLTAGARFDMISDTSLQATIVGQKYNPSTHTLSLDVKAITYHHVMVKKIDDCWIVRVFVDI